MTVIPASELRDPVKPWNERYWVWMGRTERLVLGYLWGRQNPVNISTLTRQINIDERSDRARTTYQTVLDRLVDKGLVAKEVRKGEGYFRAVVSKEDIRQKLLDELDSI